jgi:hypothetical protein
MSLVRNHGYYASIFLGGKEIWPGPERGLSS